MHASMSPGSMEENVEVIKWLIRSRKSKKDRLHNDRKKKRTNSDLQNNTQKTKDRATRTPLKIGDELRCSGRIGNSCFLCETRRVTLVRSPDNNLQMSKSIYDRMKYIFPKK